MIEMHHIGSILSDLTESNMTLLSRSVRLGFFLPYLICSLILILLLIGLALILREVMRESTKQCPYCDGKIPKDAMWCKFCRSDLTRGFSPDTLKKEREDVGKPCPDCDKGTRYIEKYDRWYCDNCRDYK